MSVYISHGLPSTSSRPPAALALVCNFTPSSSKSPIKRISIPATDRVIDFGKHRGMMLGTLPSKYLKWVSKNLRARDFEEWAKLADEVLQDPVYKDRIEWEYAESILTGDNGTTRTRGDSVVDELLEFSERFGWDNDDKIGWSRIDFSLLGTSNARRIPRKGGSALDGDFGKKKNKLGVLGEGEEEVGARKKREERIERRRLRRGVKINNLEEKPAHVEAQEEEMVIKTSNPFPGREALLKKVFEGKRVV